MSLIIIRLKKFKMFIGAKVWNLFVLAVFLGVFWFLIESSFVFIFQAYLHALKLIPTEKMMVPDWIPLTPLSASLFLILFGVARGFTLMLRNYFSGVTNQSFIRHQKFIILKFALLSENRLPTFNIITAFNDWVASAGATLQNLSVLICSTIVVSLYALAGFFIAPKELILACSLLGLFIIPTRFFDQKIKISGDHLHKEREIINRTLMLGLKNNFFLRLYNMIFSEISRGNIALNSYEKHYKQFHFMTSMRISYPISLGAFVISIVSFVSLNYFETSGIILISFFYIFVRFSQGISDIFSVLGEVKVHFPAFRELYNWYIHALESLEKIEKKDATKTQPQQKVNKIEIVVKNLCFKYPDGRSIFKNFDFKIEPSNILILKGESGSGKSTLLSLILGVIKPTAGQVLINSVPAEKMIENISNSIGYVGPDPFLIPGTVRENLTYGLQDESKISDDLIWDSIRKSNMESEIKNLPKQLDEFIFEWAQLSTGQRQRLAIARALLRNPSLLILDEATANIDEATESKIIHMIKDASKYCTVIVVSHKKSFDLIGSQFLNLNEI